MRHSFSRLLLVGLMLASAAGTLATARDFADSRVGHIEYPAWFKESFLEINTDIEEALASEKLGLMVLFTSEGCSYCHAFIERSLGDPALNERLRAHFDVIGLDIFDDAELVDQHGEVLRVKHFAKREGAGFSPTLLFYGENGALLYRGVGYHSPERFGVVLDYLIEGRYQDASFRDYVVSVQGGATSGQAAYQLRADPLFASPPYALDRSRFPAQRPLLVIFEADGCEDCPMLHDKVLALPEVRQLLEHFEVVRLDARDMSTPVLTPDGRRTTAAAWYAATGFSRLPAMLFFEESGKEVLGTDALVLRQRMLNSLLYTLERAYEKDWTYQRFARSKGIERNQQRNRGASGDPQGTDQDR